MAKPAKPTKGAKAGNAGDELGRAIVALLLKEPFYGHLLGGIVRRIGDEVPTAAVALTPRGPELIVNPAFFLQELNAQERAAVIKHEALHLVFRHLYRPLIKNSDAKLFNVAADLVVNQLVAPWPLPEGAITLALFPDLKLPLNQTLEWYYERLANLRKDPASAPNSAAALEQAMGEPTHSDHRFWAAGGGFGFGEQEGGDGQGPMSEALRNALEGDIERHLIRARDRSGAKAWGSMPAGLRSLLEQVEAKRKPKVDWRRTLRIFASSGCRTRVVPTQRRMSKRFGTFPGVRIKREQRIAVAIDTSGSIGSRELSLFFSEINGIWRTGADVVVVECDAAVQRAYTYKGKPPEEAKGGGGTAFEPAFAWMREPRNGKFDACIYLTDGYGPEPSTRPRCPVMWVLTNASGAGPHLKWGPVVVLQAD